MIPDSLTTERQLIEQFLATLQALPEAYAEFVQLESGESVRDLGYDARINLKISGQSIVLLIEVKKTVYPRDVHQILWQLKQLRFTTLIGRDRDGTVSVLLAESISPGAKELLREERVGYYDSGGSLFLSAQSAYVYVEKPLPKSLSKSIRSLFSGRRAQVLHTLLANHQDWFSGKDLAKKAQVSPATASQVLTELDRFDWLASRGQGPSKERHLEKPTLLLDAWAEQVASVRPPTLRRYYIPATKAGTLMEHVGRVFATHDVGYAFSHVAAAQHYAPFLSNVSLVRCRVLMSNKVDAALGELEARVVNHGANFEQIESKSPGELLYREQVGGIWLASPFQVYLDLLQGEGRANEMANHLRKERIGF